MEFIFAKNKSFFPTPSENSTIYGEVNEYTFFLYSFREVIVTEKRVIYMEINYVLKGNVNSHLFNYFPCQLQLHSKLFKLDGAMDIGECKYRPNHVHNDSLCQ